MAIQKHKQLLLNSLFFLQESGRFDSTLQADYITYAIESSLASQRLYAE